MDAARAAAVLAHPGLVCERCGAKASILSRAEGDRCRRCRQGSMTVVVPRVIHPERRQLRRRGRRVIWADEAGR